MSGPVVLDENRDCPHGLAEGLGCWSCTHPADGERVAEPTELVMEAKYPGPCANCDDQIRVGDRIRRWDDDTWRHDDCG